MGVGAGSGNRTRIVSSEGSSFSYTLNVLDVENCSMWAEICQAKINEAVATISLPDIYLKARGQAQLVSF